MLNQIVVVAAAILYCALILGADLMLDAGDFLVTIVPQANLPQKSRPRSPRKVDPGMQTSSFCDSSFRQELGTFEENLSAFAGWFQKD